jgi:hypothetical protein
MISLYQSPVKCRIRKVKGNFKHRRRYYFPSEAWNLYSYLKEQGTCLLKGEVSVEFSKWTTSWKIILERMIDNNITSKVDALMYVVLSKAEKHVPYGELVGTTVPTHNLQYNAISEVSHNPRSL